MSAFWSVELIFQSRHFRPPFCSSIAATLHLSAQCVCVGRSSRGWLLASGEQQSLHFMILWCDACLYRSRLGRPQHLSAFRSDMLDVRQKLPFLRNKNVMLIGGGEALRFELPPQAASPY